MSRSTSDAGSGITTKFNLPPRIPRLNAKNSRLGKPGGGLAVCMIAPSAGGKKPESSRSRVKVPTSIGRIAPMLPMRRGASVDKRRKSPGQQKRSFKIRGRGN